MRETPWQKFRMPIARAGFPKAFGMSSYYRPCLGNFVPERKTVFDTSHYRPSKHRNGSAALVGVSQAVSVTEYGERLAYCGGATPIVGTSGKGPPEVIERSG